MEDLKTVIRAFQADVRRAVALFRQHSGLDNVVNWRSHGLSRTGYLDSEKRHPYAFHGVGCRLRLGRMSHIDWDFGHNGRLDGFDRWRLRKFLIQRRKLQRVLPLTSLDEAFELAIKDGTVVSPWRLHHDNLYYLLEDLNSDERA